MARSRKQRVNSGRDPEFSRDGRKRGLFGKATGVVLAVFVLALSVAIIVPIAPEYQKLKEVEAEHAEALDAEKKLLRKRRQYELESESLMTNLEYLESRSRDRGPYYAPGEQVIKITE